MTDTTLTSQTKQILANPFISTPIVFSLEKDNQGNVTHLYQSFFKSNALAGASQKVLGSIVSNPDVVGASAQVLVTKGKVNGHASQRLLIKTQGPQSPALQKTLDFFPVFAASGVAAAPADGTNLYLSVSDGILLPHEDAGKFASANAIPPIPLIVGPDSAVLGEIHPEALAQLNELGIDWGGLFNIAKKVLPVVAKSGYQIYQELNTKPTAQAQNENLGGFLDGLLSVAKIAVPIAGSLISAL